MLCHFIGLLLWLAAVIAAGSYLRDPNVFELTPKTFDKVVHGLNYTTVVEFYAPWCGYCQKLHSSYSKLGKFVHDDSQYAINIAAVNCDDDVNRPLCAEYRIQGFPTVMVFRPPRYDGSSKKTDTRHISEVYQGERSFKAILNFVTSRLKNYVKKFKLDGSILPKWLAETLNEKPRVLLVTKNAQVSPLLKLLAIDYLERVDFGIVPAKQPVEKFTVGDEVVEIKEATLPMLVHYNTKTKLFEKFPGAKLNDKTKIAQWVTKVTGQKPAEGSLLKLGKKLYKIRTGKKAPASDFGDEL